MTSTEKLDEKLAAFEKTKNPDPMIEAFDIVESFDVNTEHDRVAARREGMTCWMHFFNAVDQAIDPTWDPKDLPELSVTPPPSNGVTFFSGVDPKSLTDPVARAEYERAIQKNRDKVLQAYLHDLDGRAMDSMKRFIATVCAGSEQARIDFETALAASSLTEARRQRLRALLPKP